VAKWRKVGVLAWQAVHWKTLLMLGTEGPWRNGFGRACAGSALGLFGPVPSRPLAIDLAIPKLELARFMQDLPPTAAVMPGRELTGLFFRFVFRSFVAGRSVLYRGHGSASRRWSSGAA
jgi:hypothetical protein